MTGGSGMVGANLIHRLLEEGFQVFVMTRSEANCFRIRTVQNKLHLMVADITDAQAVRSVVSGVRPDILYHLASTSFNPDVLSAEDHFRVNVMGTLHILEAMKEAKAVRLVFTSSAAEYGNGEHLREDCEVRPETMLGASKASANILIQTYVRLYGIQAVLLRLFTPYGPWESDQRFVPHVILSALQRKDILISHGQQERDFVYIEDVVDALMLAGTQKVESGSIFNIASGEGVPVHKVAALILRLMKNPVKLTRGAVPTRPDEIMKMSANISKAKKVLGWKPRIGLEEGEKKTIAWLTKRENLGTHA